MRHRPLLTPTIIFALALAHGFLYVSGTAAALSFLLVGLCGGALLRSWRGVPILALGIFLGNVARIVNDASWLLTDLRADDQTLRLLGKGAFGLLLAYVPLTLLLAIPVALGKWLATPRPPRTLANWHR